MWYLYLNINLNWFFIVRWWIEKILTYLYFFIIVVLTILMLHFQVLQLSVNYCL